MPTIHGRSPNILNTGMKKKVSPPSKYAKKVSIAFGRYLVSRSSVLRPFEQKMQEADAQFPIAVAKKSSQDQLQRGVAKNSCLVKGWEAKGQRDVRP